MSMQQHHEGERNLLKIDTQKAREYEEKESEVFKARAKMFRFEKTENKWKERGVGDIRLLKHADTKISRVLMRRDKTLKVCANHYPSGHMKLEASMGGEKTWVYQAKDYSDGVSKDEVLAIRFTTAEIAQDFKKQFEVCAKENEEEWSKIKEDDKKEDDEKKDDEKNNDNQDMEIEKK
eukprot:Anaeramoba_ignava/a4519_178.p1 GENE.a4519_178~~a4519_178.p1  ORF type:complete len:178 (-),score=72.14 a4519_178:103-636(-)